MLSTFGLEETKAESVKVGDLFGRLEVIAVGQVPNTYRYYAICKCSCGSKEKKIRFDGLTSGLVVSCGCFHKSKITSHGLYKSVHYSRWQNMVSRCNNPKSTAYMNYGGRGIKVCEAWMNVERFIEDLPEGYFDGAEIDRIDNDGDYEPGNVRWSSPGDNCDNRRTGRLITAHGKTQSLRKWAEETGIDERLIWSRIESLGWSDERSVTDSVMQLSDVVRKAITTRWAGHYTKGRPAPKTGRRLKTVEFQGEVMTMAQLSKATGLPARTLYRRIFEQNIPIDIAIQ